MGASRTRWSQKLSAGALAVGSTLALFVAYLGLAQVNYLFVIPPGQSAVFWMPSGLTFALFVRARRAPRLWPGWLVAIFLGELLVVRLHSIPLRVAVIWALANILLPLSAALLARRWVTEPFGLRRLRDVVLLGLMAGLSVAPGALLAGVIAEPIADAPLGAVAISWGVSDALGILLVAPVLLTWTAPTSRRATRRIPEAIGLLLALVGVSWLVFTRETPSPLDQSLPSLLYLLVAWVSIRFGPRMTSLALLGMDVMLVGATAHHLGPLGTSGLPLRAQFLNLQILQAALGLLMFLLAASIAEQRDARRVAEEALRVRDDFLRTASHELRTPLTSVQLSVQHLLSKKEPSARRTDHLLELIDRQVSKLGLLIEEMLDTTRILQGRLHLELKEIDLSAVVREVVDRLAGRAAQTGSTLSIKAETPIIGYWDQSSLEQIIANLLSNALKFGAGKPIELRVELEAPEVARISVEDHGIGIAPEQLPLVFEQFAQAVAQRRHGGLGLGLFIVRALVDSLGGSVTVESVLGQGSTFTVRLPLRPVPPAPT